MSKTLFYPKGTIVLFEEGEYSDFGYCGQVVTLQDLDLRAAATEFKQKHAGKGYLDGPNPYNFVAWLCVRQICAHLECQTVHIGSYGKLEIPR